MPGTVCANKVNHVLGYLIYCINTLCSIYRTSRTKMLEVVFIQKVMLSHVVVVVVVVFRFVRRCSSTSEC